MSQEAEIYRVRKTLIASADAWLAEGKRIDYGSFRCGNHACVIGTLPQFDALIGGAELAEKMLQISEDNLWDIAFGFDGEPPVRLETPWYELGVELRRKYIG